MIVGSLMLILVAVVLLVLGLTSGSAALLIMSIAASLLAAVALVVGARQTAGARRGRPDGESITHQQAPGGGDGEPPRRGRVAEPPRDRADRAASWAGAADGGSVVLEDPVDVGVAGGRRTDTRLLHEPAPARAGAAEPGDGRTRADPAGADPARADPAGGTETGDVGYPAAGAADGDPSDEPGPQPVSPADAARVARLHIEVLVVDGRPRYHLAGCGHLVGRATEAVPVSEAVGLGFTPCGRCEPDRRLLADAHLG